MEEKANVEGIGALEKSERFSQSRDLCFDYNIESYPTPSGFILPHSFDTCPLTSWIVLIFYLIDPSVVVVASPLVLRINHFRLEQLCNYSHETYLSSILDHGKSLLR